MLTWGLMPLGVLPADWAGVQVSLGVMAAPPLDRSAGLLPPQDGPCRILPNGTESSREQAGLRPLTCDVRPVGARFRQTGERRAENRKMRA